MAVTFMEAWRYVPPLRSGLVSAQSAVSSWSRIEGRFGPGSWALNHNAGASTENPLFSGEVYFPGAGGSEGALGVALYHQQTGGGSNWGSNAINCYATSNGWAASVQAGSAPGASFTQPSQMSAGVPVGTHTITPGWHWWSMAAKINSNTDGYVRLWMDGVLVFQWAPDTLYLSGVTLNWWKVGVGSSSTKNGIDIGDVVVTNTAEMVPDTRVESLLPNADASGSWVGSDGDSVDNWALVSAPGPSRNSAGRLTGSSTGSEQRFYVPSLPYVPTEVVGVQANTWLERTELGSRASVIVAGTGAGELTDRSAGGSASAAFANNPSGPAWTSESVSSTSYGLRLVDPI